MSEYTPEHYIEAWIIKDALDLKTNNIAMLLSQRDSVTDDDFNDSKESFRSGGLKCNLLSTANSRHYEVDFVYDLVFDRLIGWDYWHGGGKHGEPSAMDWMPTAEFLKVLSVEKITKYTLGRISNEEKSTT